MWCQHLWVFASLLLRQVRLAAGVAAGNPYVQVLAQPELEVSRSEATKSKKFLIASFPDLRQVAYCHLPNNVWRPLVVEPVVAPGGLTLDVSRNRLYVADPPSSKIYWYELGLRSDGSLRTFGSQNIAVDGYAADWMTVNALGDLYFTGKAVVAAPASTYGAVYRVNGQYLARGISNLVEEVYGRSNTGNPYPTVWMPSGIAVDSFNIYWGNMEAGLSSGSLCKGLRSNIQFQRGLRPTSKLSASMDLVMGIAATGNNLFYLTPQGVYGVPKAQATTVTDPSEGRVSFTPATDANSPASDPRSIAWDGDGSLFFTDYSLGMVYSLPANDINVHNITEFAVAPGVSGLTVLNWEISGARQQMQVVRNGWIAVVAWVIAFFVSH